MRIYSNRLLQIHSRQHRRSRDTFQILCGYVLRGVCRELLHPSAFYEFLAEFSEKWKVAGDSTPVAPAQSQSGNEFYEMIWIMNAKCMKCSFEIEIMYANVKSHQLGARYKATDRHIVLVGTNEAFTLSIHLLLLLNHIVIEQRKYFPGAFHVSNNGCVQCQSD